MRRTTNNRITSPSNKDFIKSGWLISKIDVTVRYRINHSVRDDIIYLRCVRVFSDRLAILLLPFK